MVFKCKNLLVTGGSGFIGSNFINYILDKYPELKVINIDNLTYAGSLKNTKAFAKNKNYEFIKGDICDKKVLEHIFNKYNIDGVINFAAETHVDNSIKEPAKFIQSNVVTVNFTKNMGTAIKEFEKQIEDFFLFYGDEED